MKTLNKEELNDIILDWLCDYSNAYIRYPNDDEPSWVSSELILDSNDRCEVADKLTNYIIENYGKG